MGAIKFRPMYALSMNFFEFVRCGVVHSFKKSITSSFYQLPLVLTALLHVDLINIAYLTAFVFIRSS